MFGVDYSVQFPGATALKSAGAGFVVRYLSPAGNAKNLATSELRACLSGGIAVCVVWETTAQRMLSGYAGGAADAKAADAMAHQGLGLAGIPVYFACDWDTAAADQAAINAYLDGVASVIGLHRTGIYGGYWPVKRALDAGKAAFAWQTYAWSWNSLLGKTNWDGRAHIQQYQNAVHLAGIEVDFDRSMTADFGQWPRPGAVTDPVLTLGDSGPAVSMMQSRLNVWGAALTVDGSFGPATQTAVRAFQTAQGLTADGVCGPATWAVLNVDPPPPPPPAYTVTVPPPGNWQAGTLVTANGTGTDGVTWTTVTRDGKTWTTPVPG